MNPAIGSVWISTKDSKAKIRVISIPSPAGFVVCEMVEDYSKTLKKGDKTSVAVAAFGKVWKEIAT